MCIFYVSHEILNSGIYLEHVDLNEIKLFMSGICISG